MLVPLARPRRGPRKLVPPAALVATVRQVDVIAPARREEDDWQPVGPQLVGPPDGGEDGVSTEIRRELGFRVALDRDAWTVDVEDDERRPRRRLDGDVVASREVSL